MRVLLIVEDEVLATHLDAMLACEGFKLEQIAPGEDALAFASYGEFDVIVLDLDRSSVGAIAGLRRSKLRTPILALTMRPVPARVQALRAGADDCLAKPFHKDELTARLKALVRRTHGHASSQIEIGPLVVDLEHFTASVAGRRMPLTPKEFDILSALALRKGQVVDKTKLFNAMYGNEPSHVPELKIIDVFVCKIRKRLAEAGAPGLIETVWARGWTLKAEASASRAAA